MRGFIFALRLGYGFGEPYDRNAVIVCFDSVLSSV